MVAPSKRVHAQRAPAPTLDFRSWIVFEDEQLIAVNKPAGILSQGGEGGAGHNLVDLARVYLGKDSGIGVLHRLDRNVSGLVMLAKQPRAASKLTRDFAAGKVSRTYIAIVSLDTMPKEPSLTVHARLRKNEKTNEVSACSDTEWSRMPANLQAEYKPSETQVTLVRHWPSVRTSPTPARRAQIGECRVSPITGRSHQIRVHLAYVGMPIVGDPKYGKIVAGLSRPLLHAQELEFSHPNTGKNVVLTSLATWDGFAVTSL